MPFELVVCDIIGPFMMAEILGYIYVGKVTDFYPRSIAIYPLDDKIDALATVQQFSKALVIPLGLCVQCRRLDEGVRYAGMAFHGYSLSTGVRFEPHCSQHPTINWRV